MITGYAPVAIRSTYWASWREIRKSVAVELAIALESHGAVIRLEPVDDRPEKGCE